MVESGQLLWGAAVEVEGVFARSTWQMLFTSHMLLQDVSHTNQSQGLDSDQLPWFRSTYRWHRGEERGGGWGRETRIDILPSAAAANNLNKWLYSVRQQRRREWVNVNVLCACMCSSHASSQWLLSFPLNTNYTFRKQMTPKKNLKSKKKKTGATDQEHWPATYYNTAGPAAAVTIAPFTELQLTWN